MQVFYAPLEFPKANTKNSKFWRNFGEICHAGADLWFAAHAKFSKYRSRDSPLISEFVPKIADFVGRKPTFLYQ